MKQRVGDDDKVRGVMRLPNSRYFSLPDSGNRSINIITSSGAMFIVYSALVTIPEFCSTIS